MCVCNYTYLRTPRTMIPTGPDQYRCTCVGPSSPAIGLLPHGLLAIVGGLFLVCWWCVMAVYGMSCPTSCRCIIVFIRPFYFLHHAASHLYYHFARPYVLRCPLSSIVHTLRAFALTFYPFLFHSLFFLWSYFLFSVFLLFYELHGIVGILEFS